jgi:hypothetical protein
MPKMRRWPVEMKVFRNGPGREEGAAGILRDLNEVEGG